MHSRYVLAFAALLYPAAGDAAAADLPCADQVTAYTSAADANRLAAAAALYACLAPVVSAATLRQPVLTPSPGEITIRPAPRAGVTAGVARGLDARE